MVGDDQRLDGLACIATTRRDREAETVGLPYAVDQSMRTAKQAPKEANRRTIIGPHAAAAPGLLIFTGARLREILHLKWGQIDFERGLLLPTSKTGKKTIVLNAPALAILNIVIIECPRKTRSDLAMAMNIQPIIQDGEDSMGTATTLAPSTTIWGLRIWGGEDCGLTSASRIGAHTTEVTMCLLLLTMVSNGSCV